MCGPDVINLIQYDGKDPKVKADIDKLKAKLQKRKEGIQAALDEIKKRFGV
jgi:hypothetical protein